MAPRYQTNKGYNKCNADKRLFEDEDIPLIINKEFLTKIKEK